MSIKVYDKWLLIPDDNFNLPTTIGGIHIEKLKEYLDKLEERIEDLEAKVRGEK